MAAEIRLRHSLLARMLTASLVIALLSIVSTAWLVTRSTTLSIAQDRGQVLADDTRIQDVLTGYAARNRDWSTVGPIVQDLAERTGRVITLTTADRELIASSRRGRPSLAARAAAVIDPLHPGPGPGEQSEPAIIDSRVVGPFALPIREQDQLRRVVLEHADCLDDFGYTVQTMITASGRSSIQITWPPGPVANNLCRSDDLRRPTKTEAAALEQLRRLVVGCARRQGVPDADDLVITPERQVLYKGTREQIVLLDDCTAQARRTQMAPYVAPPALLFISSASSVITAGLDLSPAGAARIGAVTALVLVVTFAIATVIAVRQVRPLRALAAAAQDPSDHHVRVLVTTKDETGYLAAALNDLSRRRAHAETQRRDMVSDIAHELRTPLTNIRGWLEAAQDGIAAPDAALLASLQEEALLLQHIIDDLQILSTTDAGTLQLSREPVPVPGLLEQVAAAHRAGAEAAGITVRTEAVGAPTVLADPLRLRQVLGNLMSNAIRHTPPGGTITLSTQHAGPDTLISVSDTGSGIAPADLPKVFDRFWRADKSRSRRSGGSGLGLCIVNQLVQAHQGTVNAVSTPGVRTVFTLRLPADPPTSTEPA